MAREFLPQQKMHHSGTSHIKCQEVRCGCTGQCVYDMLVGPSCMALPTDEHSASAVGKLAHNGLPRSSVSLSSFQSIPIISSVWIPSDFVGACA